MGTLDGIEPDKARMEEVLELGKDPVTAEPLYVLLPMAEHPDAHEETRVLARQARVSKKPLTQVIKETRALDVYFKNLSPNRCACTHRGNPPLHAHNTHMGRTPILPDYSSSLFKMRPFRHFLRPLYRAASANVQCSDVVISWYSRLCPDEREHCALDSLSVHCFFGRNFLSN
jgi:hypothetical protein